MQVEVRWLEGKRIEVSARGNRLIVDEIYADGRVGMGFRPTELLLGALGACTMGTVLTFCKNMNIPVESFVIDVEGKRETSPERISEIQVSLRLAGDIPEQRLETLKRVAKGCRIHHTITQSPPIGIELKAGEKTG
ncbi:MAG: OsmC family protein [Betaproteobacteria bacterium]|nr:OsmC family protein [Betaproteobacteria bacterium]